MKILVLKSSGNKKGSSNMRTVIGKGCGTPSMTAGTDYPKMAYELGLSI